LQGVASKTRYLLGGDSRVIAKLNPKIETKNAICKGI